jgi:molybdate transport system ATP-binding protein
MTLTVDIERQLGAFHLKTAFEAGEGVTALFGRSGAGKTSVVNAIASCVGPGRIVINGGPGSTASAASTCRRAAAHRRVQKDGWAALERAAESALCGPFSAVRRRRNSRVVELRIEGSPRSHAGKPPGGEKQRRGRALLCRSGLLLDEPLARSTRTEQILQYIELLRDEVNPILYVSHAVEVGWPTPWC